MGAKWYFLCIQQPQELRIATVPPLTPASPTNMENTPLPSPFQPTQPTQYQHRGKSPSNHELSMPERPGILSEMPNRPPSGAARLAGAVGNAGRLWEGREQSKWEDRRKIGMLTVRDGNDNNTLTGMNRRLEGASNAPRNMAMRPRRTPWLPTLSLTNIELPCANEVAYGPHTGASPFV
ncbi:hypothetical protein F5146DRAFT_1001827 [Armillaria mellea]|nr:hypothetical protein F5146DRAFT_1001827 [Armillaria mellea]